MFVVCGEALMDVFGVRDTPGGMDMDARVGGSPLNVALGLTRLGQRAAFVCTLSRDFLGERIVRFLQQEGVDLSLVQRSASRTTLSLVGVDSKGVPAYSFYGEGAADRELDLRSLGELPETVRAIHLGSFAVAVQPVGTALRQLVERERARRLIVWDPNIRLNVQPDLAPWRELLEWMLPRCDIVKISDEDLHLLLPGTSPEGFADKARAAGCSLVVVTRGAQGAVAWSRGAQAEVPAQPADLVDTVGAGDTFQAAMLTWLAEGDRLSKQGPGALDARSLARMLEFAARAAAITCSRRGADLPRRDELPR
ncbi:MAG: carbohydrate kinase [Betaproteobacteria bacterium]|nr:carbohydrate kinase [Betaproteobacteria bacterium]